MFILLPLRYHLINTQVIQHTSTAPYCMFLQVLHIMHLYTKQLSPSTSSLHRWSSPFLRLFTSASDSVLPILLSRITVQCTVQRNTSKSCRGLAYDYRRFRSCKMKACLDNKTSQSRETKCLEKLLFAIPNIFQLDFFNLCAKPDR